MPAFMRARPAGRSAPVFLALVALIAAGFSAYAATIEEVDAETTKANNILKSASCGAEISAEQRARILSDAVEDLHGVIEMIEKVPNLTPEERDKKTSEVMAVIFWCKKMTPLNLSGGSIELAKISGKALTAAAGEDKGGGQTPAAAPKAEKAIEYDELAFNRAKACAAAHPGDLEDCAARFEALAACYPNSKWAEKGLQEAKQIRAKLDAQHNNQQPLLLRIEKLDLTGAIADLEKESAAENDKPKKDRLLQTKKDIEILQEMFGKFIKYTEGKAEFLNVPFEDLSINRKGGIKSVGKPGLVYATSAKDGPVESGLVSWNDFGAKAMMRLAQKVWPTPNVDALVERAIAATACEEYIAAQNCFSRLLIIAPEEVKNLNNYFVRAQYGYTNSAEVLAHKRFDEAKNLFKKKDYKNAMAALTDLQKDLAANSSLAVLLKEINRFRAASRRQYEIDDAGAPISKFEKMMRAAFFGNVKVDENTGKLEAFYDFSDPEQLRDWRYNRASQDWKLQNGRMVNSGLEHMLAWVFPLTDISATADVVYNDPNKTVYFHMLVNLDKKQQGFISWVRAGCCDGKAKMRGGGDGDHTTIRSRTGPDYAWRPGETANVGLYYDATKNMENLEIEQLYINNHLAIGLGIRFVDSKGDPRDLKGGIGFGFEKGGTGSVTNVHITGKLDLDALKATLAGAPGAQGAK